MWLVHHHKRRNSLLSSIVLKRPFPNYLIPLSYYIASLVYFYHSNSEAYHSHECKQVFPPDSLAILHISGRQSFKWPKYSCSLESILAAPRFAPVFQACFPIQVLPSHALQSLAGLHHPMRTKGYSSFPILSNCIAGALFTLLVLNS